MARRRTPHMASADEKPLSEAELRGMEASALVEAAKSGDPNAFDALVRRYRSRGLAPAPTTRRDASAWTLSAAPQSSAVEWWVP